MKSKKTITVLVLIIAILSLIASVMGIFSNGGTGAYTIESFRGEMVKIHGFGLYKIDSVSVAAQGIAQDIVTLLIGIPLLLISLSLARKGQLKGRLLLTGTLAYFLYTYISYVFLWMYNPMFIVYVVLMSASFFAFTIQMLSFDVEKLKGSFNEKLPVKIIGGFQIFLGCALFFMWIGKIIPTITSATVPVGLEHYTTLVIQGLDLGFIVPVALFSGIMIIRRRSIGYLLSSVVIMKGITMGAAISAMVVGQYLAGVQMSIVEIVIFPLFSILIACCMFILLKNLKREERKK